MKLYTFEFAGQPRLGAECRGQLVDLAAASAALIRTGRLKADWPALPSDMLTFLRLGKAALTTARDTLALMARRPALPVGERTTFVFDEVKLLPPVLRPGKILCASANAVRESSASEATGFRPESCVFAKLPSALIGSGEAILQPGSSQPLESEIGLAVVIGKHLRNVALSEATQAIAGYAILQDVGLRGAHPNQPRFVLAKNFDTFCPFGPCLVTSDDLRPAQTQRARCFVNNELVQDSSLDDSLLHLPALIHGLSNVMTLEPGDVVSTALPLGQSSVCQAHLRLAPGDAIRIEIEGIGVLENRVELVS